MPLDSQRKIAHILTITNRSFQGRQKVIVFVYQSSGTYTYTATSVIFRPLDIIDPTIPDLAGRAPGIPGDMLMIAPLATNFTGLIMVADTSTATSAAAAAAKRYQLIEAVNVGIVPGGSHIRATFRRLR